MNLTVFLLCLTLCVVVFSTRAESRNLAFSAKLTNNIDGANLGPRVIFDRVLLNEGEAYDAKSGKFRASTAGIYQFSVHLCSEPSKSGAVFLMKQGQTVDYTWCGLSTWACSSVSTVVKLQQEESVWVELRGHMAGMYTETSNYLHFRSGFSGVYIGQS